MDTVVATLSRRTGQSVPPTPVATLKTRQACRVARLTWVLNKLTVEGNEYHAQFVRGDIVAARSLARLVHKAPAVGARV